MGGHETIGQNVHVLAQILLDVLQKVEIVLPLEEDRLAVVAAVVEVIILVGQKRRFAAGYDRSETSEAPKSGELRKFGGNKLPFFCLSDSPAKRTMLIPNFP